MRAVSYARISLDRREGAGVERQQADTRKLADLHDLDVVAELVENNVSAWSGKKRPEYARLLDMIRAGQVDRVLVWHTDRLHRNVGELVDYLDLTRSHGVKTLAKQGNGYDPEAADGKFLATVLGAVAEQESDHKSERVRRAIRQSRERGEVQRTRYRTFGYEHDGETIVETEAQFLRDAARRVLDGDTLRRICREGQTAGVTTTTGGTMTTTALRRLLLNPRIAGLSSVAVAGHDRPREVIGVGQWEPIYSPETHEQLVAALTNPNRATNREGTAPRHLLTGIATCVCGGTVCASTAPANRQGVRHPIYRCRTKRDNFTPGPHVSRRIADLDGYVKAYVLDMLARMDLSDYLTSTTDDGGKLDRLLTERARLETVLDDLEARYLTLRTDRERAQWDRLNRATLDALDETTRAIDDAAGDTSAVAQLVGVTDIAEWWEGAELDDRRGVVAELVTVRLLPVPRGGRGFDPEYVDIRPRRAD